MMSLSVENKGREKKLSHAGYNKPNKVKSTYNILFIIVIFNTINSFYVCRAPIRNMTKIQKRLIYLLDRTFVQIASNNVFKHNLVESIK